MAKIKPQMEFAINHAMEEARKSLGEQQKQWREQQRKAQKEIREHSLEMQKQWKQQQREVQRELQHLQRSFDI